MNWIMYIRLDGVIFFLLASIANVAFEFSRKWVLDFGNKRKTTDSMVLSLFTKDEASEGQKAMRINWYLRSTKNT